MPVFSKKPDGRYSTTSTILVSVGANSWKLTAPWVEPFGPWDVHTMRSSGICSWTVASKLREEAAILVVHLLTTSSSLETDPTPLVYFPNSSYRVQWS